MRTTASLVLRSAICVLVALGAAVTAAQAREDVYYFDQKTWEVGEPDTDLRQRSLIAVERSNDEAGGRSLRVRLVWAQVENGGRGQGDTMQLDPHDRDTAALVELLRSGFQTHIDDRGHASAPVPVNQAAWDAAVAREPRLAEMFAQSGRTIGMSRHALPDELEPGQRLEFSQELPGSGEVHGTMTVLQVEPDGVLLEVSARGENIQVEGRQVLERDSGVAIEAWLNVQTDAHDGMPALRARLYLANTRHGPGLGRTLDMDIEEVLEDERFLTQDLALMPLFAGPEQERAGRYRHESLEEGMLPSWMVSAADLERVDPTLLFKFDQRVRPDRLRIGITAQLEPPRDYDPNRPYLQFFARLRDVTLLDAQGRELPGLDPVVVPRFGRALGSRTVELDESDASFPLRLPIGTGMDELQQLDRIRLSMEIDVYQWAGTEVVPAGAQSQVQPRARLHWDGRRFGMVIPFMPEPQSGLHARVVAIDAAGREIPSISTATWRPAKSAAPASSTVPRLAWEHRHYVHQIEAVAKRPIAAVELRRYRWRVVPHQWDFRNARGVADGGPLVGVRYAAEPEPQPPYDVETALASVRPFSDRRRYQDVVIDGPLALQAQVAANCAVVSLRDAQQVVVDSPERYDSKWSLGWPSGAQPEDGWPAQWPVALECPAQVRHVREPVATSECFRPLSDGWLSIRPACRGRLFERKPSELAVVARDAAGVPLAPLPGESRVHALRFWGEPASLEYTLRSEATRRRELQLDALAPSFLPTRE